MVPAGFAPLFSKCFQQGRIRRLLVHAATEYQGLHALGAQYRPDPRPSQAATLIVVHVGVAHQLLAGRPDGQHGVLPPGVALPQDSLALQGVPAHQGPSIVEGHPLCADLHHRPLLRSPVQHQGVAADPRHGLEGSAAGVGFGEDPGQRALGECGVAVGSPDGKTAGWAGGQDQAAVRGQGIHPRRVEPPEQVGAQSLAAQILLEYAVRDVFAAGFTGAQIDRQQLAEGAFHVYAFLAFKQMCPYCSRLEPHLHSPQKFEKSACKSQKVTENREYESQRSEYGSWIRSRKLKEAQPWMQQL